MNTFAKCHVQHTVFFLVAASPRFASVSALCLSCAFFCTQLHVFVLLVPSSAADIIRKHALDFVSSIDPNARGASSLAVNFGLSVVESMSNMFTRQKRRGRTTEVSNGQEASSRTISYDGCLLDPASHREWRLQAEQMADLRQKWDQAKIDATREHGTAEHLELPDIVITHEMTYEAPPGEANADRPMPLPRSLVGLVSI